MYAFHCLFPTCVCIILDSTYVHSLFTFPFFFFSIKFYNLSLYFTCHEGEEEEEEEELA
jgi:hypothetical protein